MATPQFGMFGPLPWEVQQMQNQQFEQAAIQRAQLSPGAHNTVMSALGGRSLGQGIAGAFGIQDPAVARSKQLQAIQKEVVNSGVDPSNFEAYYGKLGEALAKAGLMREAASVADALQAYKDKQAALETKQHEAETARMKVEAFRNSKLKSDLAKYVYQNIKEFDLDSVKRYTESVTDTNPDGDPSLLKRYADKEWSFAGTSPDGQPVFTNKQGEVGRINPETKKLAPYGSSVLPKSAIAITNNVGDAPLPNGLSPKTAEEYSKQFGAAKAKFMEKYDLGDALRPVITEMEAMLTNVDPNSKFGQIKDGEFAPEFMQELRRFGLEYFGVGDPRVLNANDVFDAYTKNVVMPKLKAFGGSDSEKELVFAEKSFANRKMTKDAMLRLIRAYQRDIARMDKIAEAENEALASGIDPALANFSWATGKYNKRAASTVPKGTGTAKDPTSGKVQVPAQPLASQPPVRTVTLPDEPPPSVIASVKRRHPNATDEQIRQAWIKQKQGMQ
jgi:hypothetical protein